MPVAVFASAAILLSVAQMVQYWLGILPFANTSWTQYRTECLRVLTLHDAVPATLKTVAFGFVVGVVGCYFGMNARGGTEGVGRAATASVVVSIFLVLVCDVVLVKVIQVLS